jgi:hypothetical protein
MREERRIARERELVRPAELEATDVRLEGTGSSRNVAGRVRNRSSHEVYAITFLVSFLEASVDVCSRKVRSTRHRLL